MQHGAHISALMVSITGCQTDLHLFPLKLFTEKESVNTYVQQFLLFLPFKHLIWDFLYSEIFNIVSWMIY